MTWTPPDTKRILEVVDKTWTAAEFIPCGPFTLRRGNNGGKRVSSASLSGTYTSADIHDVTNEMARIGQPELFQISDTDGALDDTLAGLGYGVIDRVTLFAVPVDLIADVGGATGTLEPTPDMTALWAKGGISEGRLDVMRRVSAPKTCLSETLNNQPAAVAFVGCDGDTAMFHALEVRQSARRNGLGQRLIRATAAWAKSQGATTLTLVVLSGNEAACGLYKSLGMVEAGRYHYRIRRETIASRE